jgi:LmbE family N-acetylglucosaminyl deacetylase
MNILAFFAHPDDETMLGGGTLALLATLGANVHYLCATRGEGGEAGEPPVCSREELGHVREQELVCAVQALGGRSLSFLGHVDPTVGEDDKLYAFDADLTFLAGQMAATLDQFDIQAVLTHGSNGEYGHPAHILVHQAAMAGVASMGKTAPLLYGVQAAFTEHPRPRLMNKDDPAHLVIDCEPVRQQKTSAALCHKTQNALFVRRSSQEAGRQLSVPEVITTLESLHRLLPAADSVPNDALAQLLLGSGQARKG